MFYGEVRKYTVMAIKHCELYVLNKKDFKQVFLMEFRDIGVELVENAYSRKNRTRKTYKEALSYLSKVDEMGATEVNYLSFLVYSLCYIATCAIGEEAKYIQESLFRRS